MILEIKDGVVYDTEKTFGEQTENFINYANDLYQKEVQEMYPEYPDFDNDGNITYNFEDDFLNYAYKRVQVHPFSTSNRSIEELIIKITVK